MLSQSLIEELYQIIQEDYQVKLSETEVKDFAVSIVGYFDTVLQVQYENEYGKGKNGA